jgi:hypothetical protein
MHLVMLKALQSWKQPWWNVFPSDSNTCIMHQSLLIQCHRQHMGQISEEGEDSNLVSPFSTLCANFGLGDRAGIINYSSRNAATVGFEASEASCYNLPGELLVKCTLQRSVKLNSPPSCMATRASLFFRPAGVAYCVTPGLALSVTPLLTGIQDSDFFM